MLSLFMIDFFWFFLLVFTIECLRTAHSCLMALNVSCVERWDGRREWKEEKVKRREEVGGRDDIRRTWHHYPHKINV